MSARITKNAAQVMPPFGKDAADNTGAYGVFRKATTTSGQSDSIPSAWLGCYVDLISRGTWTQYSVTLSGDTAPTLVGDQAGWFAAQDKRAGKTILADSKETVWIPPNASKLNWVCGDATSGHYFEGCLSGPKKGR